MIRFNLTNRDPDSQMADPPAEPFASPAPTVPSRLGERACMRRSAERLSSAPVVGAEPGAVGDELESDRDACTAFPTRERLLKPCIVAR